MDAPVVDEARRHPGGEPAGGLARRRRPGQDHLAADEDEHEGERGLEEAEILHETGEGEIHRTQAHDREDVRGEGDEALLLDGQVRRQDAEDGGDRVDREDQVGTLDDQQHQEERGEAPDAVLLDPEFVAVQMRGEREELPGDPDEQVLVHALALGLVMGQGQLDAGEEQESPEEGQQEGETLHRGDARDDEDRAHGDRADDSPEEHAVLQVVRDLEVGEDQDEDEEVVDGEGELEHVAGGEQLGVLRPPPGGEQEAERDRQGDPHDAPGDRLLEGRLMVGLVEHPEVEGQHAGDETQEGGPCPTGDDQGRFGENGREKGHGEELDPNRAESSPPADAGLPARPEAGLLRHAFP